MTTTKSTHEKAYQKYAWILLFVVGILLALNILLVATFFTGPEQFEADTGVAWDEFSQVYPGVATAYILEQRLAYVGFASLALLALVITCFGFRKGHRWAWYAMWLLPATLALAVGLLVLSEQPEIGAYYGVFVVVTVIGLLLPIRKFFPKNRREPAAA